MVPAGRAGPRLALLLSRVALEGRHPLALGALGMLVIGGVTGPPQVFEAGVVVGELGEELMDRVVRGRGPHPDRLMAVGRWHVSTVLDRTVLSGLLDTLRDRWNCLYPPVETSCLPPVGRFCIPRW